VLHEHANHTDTPWFQKVADRWLARYTDIAIAVSASTAEFTTRARLVPANRTHVVYLGAPLDEFARPRSAEEIAAARRALGVPDGAIAIGCVTRLMPSKGNEFLVAAAPAVLAAHPTARFFLIGEGELEADLKAQAAALGLGDRFVFSGFAKDVAAVYSALDIVVFPSLWEGTPLTAFEVLAMGKPIVATDADGLLDILTDGRDALIVPKRDAEALARGILTLIEQPQLAAALAAQARVTGARFDIGVFVRKMERLYELLHESSRRTTRESALTLDLSFLHDGGAP
jgi:glycosyltransferase involved in cell wall biosynthesis